MKHRKMNAFKILFLGIDDEKRVASGQYYLRKAMAEHVKIINYGPRFTRKRWTRLNLDVAKLKRRYEPDLILLQGFWNMNGTPVINWKNLDKVTIPKAVFFSDPHNSPQKRTEWINKNKIDVSLQALKERMPLFRSQLYEGHKMFWVPWCINLNVYRDYELNRTYDVAILGSSKPNYYPLRDKIWKTLLSQKTRKEGIRVFHRPRPPGGYNVDIEKTLMRESYAMAIARCKIHVFTGSRLNYPVQKYIETMGCNTLALATIPLDASDLHFIPGHNFIEINAENFMEKIRYYLRNGDERKRIALNGYRMVRETHSCSIRAKQVIKSLEDTCMDVEST